MSSLRAVFRMPSFSEVSYASLAYPRDCGHPSKRYGESSWSRATRLPARRRPCTLRRVYRRPRVSRLRSLWYGLTLPYLALRLVLATPTLFFWSLLPIALTMALYVWVIAVLQEWALARLLSLLPLLGLDPTGWVAWTAGLVTWIVLTLVGALTFAFTSTVVAAPFNDVLAARTERHAVPPLPPPPEVGAGGHLRLVWIDLVKAVAATVTGLAAMVLAFVPVLNVIAVVAVCLLVCFQYTSYPQTRRHVRFAAGRPVPLPSRLGVHRLRRRGERAVRRPLPIELRPPARGRRRDPAGCPGPRRRRAAGASLSQELLFAGSLAATSPRGRRRSHPPAISPSASGRRSSAATRSSPRLCSIAWPTARPSSAPAVAASGCVGVAAATRRPLERRTRRCKRTATTNPGVGQFQAGGWVSFGAARSGSRYRWRREPGGAATEYRLARGVYYCVYPGGGSLRTLLTDRRNGTEVGRDGLGTPSPLLRSPTLYPAELRARAADQPLSATAVGVESRVVRILSVSRWSEHGNSETGRMAQAWPAVRTAG